MNKVLVVFFLGLTMMSCNMMNYDGIGETGIAYSIYATNQVVALETGYPTTTANVPVVIWNSYASQRVIAPPSDGSSGADVNGYKILWFQHPTRGRLPALIPSKMARSIKENAIAKNMRLFNPSNGQPLIVEVAEIASFGCSMKGAPVNANNRNTFYADGIQINYRVNNVTNLPQ